MDREQGFMSMSSFGSAAKHLPARYLHFLTWHSPTELAGLAHNKVPEFSSTGKAPRNQHAVAMDCRAITNHPSIPQQKQALSQIPCLMQPAALTRLQKRHQNFLIVQPHALLQQLLKQHLTVPSISMQTRKLSPAASLNVDLVTCAAELIHLNSCCFGFCELDLPPLTEVHSRKRGCQSDTLEAANTNLQVQIQNH
jgi:hypothetical protein